MSRLGWADLGLATLDDMSRTVEMIASLSPGMPVIADADTGYGGPVAVSRTVARYSRAGVAALHLEDQVAEKRCGHLGGKVLVDREVYFSRLRAAVAARDDLESEMLIIARTDARQGLGFDEALARLQRAVEIGVDAVFFEAPQSKEECRQVCEFFKKTNTPVLLNMVCGGATPTVSAKEAQEMGFRLMIFPSLCIRSVVKAVSEEVRHLLKTGSPNTGVETSPKAAFDICGLKECMQIDARAGGTAYEDVRS